ncbi:MAG: hypothetical protein D6795_12440 [Deltaproteobacteria bacterium]|nr:MAG: hypothetical protein D6795_12440 [Deltaproteobacteria bacterium]
MPPSSSCPPMAVNQGKSGQAPCRPSRIGQSFGESTTTGGCSYDSGWDLQMFRCHANSANHGDEDAITRFLRLLTPPVEGDKLHGV